MITLSPLTLSDISHQVTARADGLLDGGEENRVVEVVMYRCTVCHELHEWEDDAQDCCKPKEGETTGTRNCPVCGEHYESHRDAADCCLWKDIDAITRRKIADAVEAGSDWTTELGLVVRGLTVIEAIKS